MQKLVDGVHTFRAEYFATHERLFRQLAEKGQTPETLFITCSDARVVPNLITTAGPGELFTVRNVGNIVPQPSMPGGTAAAIEYAIEVLGVTDVVVCGHTHCGAITAILDPSTMDSLPMVRRWLAQADRVRTIVDSRYGDRRGAERIIAAVEENVLVQLENLRLFPFVAERLDRGALRMGGWVFKIETGQVFAFEPASGQFEEIAAPIAEPVLMGACAEA